MIFGKGKESVMASANFVGNFRSFFSSSIFNVVVKPNDNGKGKTERLKVVSGPLLDRMVCQPPPADYFKINVDVILWTAWESPAWGCC